MEVLDEFYVEFLTIADMLMRNVYIAPVRIYKTLGKSRYFMELDLSGESQRFVMFHACSLGPDRVFAIAQAVRRWLYTKEIRVQSLVT